MSILVKQFLSKGSTTENNSMLEFNNQNYAMVLEGTNGIDSNPLMPDIAWYLENFAKLLNELIDTTPLPITFLICQTINTLQIMHQIEAVKLGEPIITDTPATPFASLAIIREFHNNIEVFSLGNCTHLIQFTDPSLKMERIYDRSISTFEAAIYEEMKNNHRTKNIDMLETLALPRIQKQWNDYYGLKNKIDGYWILGFNVNAVKHGIYTTYPIDSVDKIIMFTNGFKRLEPQFASLKDDKSLYDIYKRLRIMEEEDPACNAYSRCKKNSDVASILAKITS